jgi:MFS family permease
MAMLDTTVVGIALPTIGSDFTATPALTEWIVLSYLLAVVAATLPAGRWLDEVGRRPALVLSVSGFGITSAAAGVAPGMGWLVGARIAQGLFAACLLALAPALAAHAVRPEARGRAMGLVTTLGPLGGVSGPVVGGVLVDGPGWRWIFLLNLPVAGLIALLGWWQLPDSGRLRWPTASQATEALMLAAASSTLLAALSLSGSHGLGWLCLGAVSVVAVTSWLRLPTSRALRTLLTRPGAPGPHLALLAETTAVGGLVFLLPFALGEVMGMAPSEVGLALVAFPAASLLLGPVGGVLADAWGSRRTALLGLTIFVVGLLLTVPLNPVWGLADLSWRLAIVGAGAGLFNGPNQALAMSATPPQHWGATGASTSMTRQLGFALGPALCTLLWALSDYSAFGLRAALATVTGLGLLALLPLGGRPSTSSTNQRSSQNRR